MGKKKIDMLIWVKGVNEEDEGNILKDATILKKYTSNIVVVAGPPDKLLAPTARRELLSQDGEDSTDLGEGKEKDGKQ